MESKVAVVNEMEPEAIQESVGPDESPAKTAKPNTRRAVLAGAAAAAAAFAAEAIVRPASVRAADVVLGATNNTTTPTVIQNSGAGTTVAIVGRNTNINAAPNAAAVWGDAKGAGSVAVQGTANNGVGARAILGVASAGTGVHGQGGITGVHGGGATQGVKGTSARAGVRGEGGTTGVEGVGDNYGVRGQSTNNYGVFGEGGYTGVFGSGPYGVYGSGASAGAIGTSGPGYGFYGLGSIGGVGIGDGNGYGLWGYNADSGGYGVVGQGGYRGVYASGGNAGVFGTSGYVGVWGNASTTSGLNFGVYGYSGSSGGYAGVFSGAVQVSGYLSKLGGGFKIDHPLEPETRYLVHSFVESPEMLNVYSGTATLDSRGQATIRLPRYFSAENKDVRYQLTAFGAAAPNLHVATGVAQNAFKVAGGAAGQKVCWQVTGVRQDAWAKANPIEVEEVKDSRNQGKYLYPQAFGRDREEAILHLKSPADEKLTRAPEVLRPAAAL